MKTDETRLAHRRGAYVALLDTPSQTNPRIGRRFGQIVKLGLRLIRPPTHPAAQPLYKLHRAPVQHLIKIWCTSRLNRVRRTPPDATLNTSRGIPAIRRAAYAVGLTGAARRRCKQNRLP